jgi:hypothetical protein
MCVTVMRETQPTAARSELCINCSFEKIQRFLNAETVNGLNFEIEGGRTKDQILEKML